MAENDFLIELKKPTIFYLPIPNSSNGEAKSSSARCVRNRRSIDCNIGTFGVSPSALKRLVKTTLNLLPLAASLNGVGLMMKWA